jgi:hypothetical protein
MDRRDGDESLRRDYRFHCLWPEPAHCRGMTPAEDGKWFATAKELGHLDLALTLAERSPVDPRTLSRAARDYLARDPRFALGASLAALKWLARGWGFEITGADVIQAYSHAVEAAEALGRKAEVSEPIRQIVAADTSTGMFVKQILGRRLGSGLLG